LVFIDILRTRNGGRIVEVEGFVDGSRVTVVLANGRVTWWYCSLCKSSKEQCVHVNKIVRGGY